MSELYEGTTFSQDYEAMCSRLAAYGADERAVQGTVLIMDNETEASRAFRAIYRVARHLGQITQITFGGPGNVEVCVQHIGVAETEIGDEPKVAIGRGFRLQAYNAEQTYLTSLLTTPLWPRL